ncbi:MAG: lauroyl acyltransferase [Parvibaculum sp.]|nr:lauroyl acyltransferase [Parvibaculum sp.]
MSNKALRYRLEAVAALLPVGLFKLLGLERASAFGGWLLKIIGPRVGISRRARNNIKRAMPELTQAEVEKIIRDMWENLGRTVAEYAHLDRFKEPAHRDRVSLSGAEYVEALKDKGGILVSGHFANWELMPLHLHLRGYEGGEVYRHANNPLIDKWIVKLRARAIQPVQIPKGPQGARDVLRVIRKKGFLCMLVDQKMNDGIEATLFGMKAMSPATPGGLAARYGVAVIPATFRRTKGVHFEQVLHEPIFADPDADPLAETARITQKLNDFLEAEIRENPAQWLWLHNRWPKDA